MYSADTKVKLEAAATFGVVLLIAVAPPAAIAAIEHHEARRSRRPSQAAGRRTRHEYGARGVEICV